VGRFDSNDNDDDDDDDKVTMQIFGPKYLSNDLEETGLQF